MDNEKNLPKADLSKNQIIPPTTENSTSDMTQERPENFNPYDGMLERLQKQRDDHVEDTQQYATKTRQIAGKLKGILQLSAIVMVWFFTLQFFPFGMQDSFEIVFAGIVVAIALTVVIILYFGKWIVNKDRIIVYLITGLTAITLIGQLFAFFLSISWIYYIFLGIMGVLTLGVLVNENATIIEKIVIVFIVGSLAFAIVRSASILKLNRLTIEYENSPTAYPTESPTYRIFGVELD